MKPKVIKTEAEYKEALAHLETLMEAEPTAALEEEMELFAVLIENYETEHFPIGLPDPISAIQFRMEQQGLTRKDLEKYIGSQSKVSEVLNRKRPLSIGMIRALHQGLGIPAEVFLQEEGRELPAPKYDLKKYPFAEMFKEGYFNFFNGTLQQAKEEKEEILNRFFSVFQGLTFEKALPRSSAKEKMDEGALEAWQARALTLAEEQELPPYVPNVLSDEDLKHLAKLSAFDEGPDLARQFLQKRGIAFVTLKSLPHTYLDGACFKSSTGRPVIGLTLRHDRLDNFWFTLFHELAHLNLHLNQNNFAFFDDTESKDRSPDKQEKEANDFSAQHLIPDKLWKPWRKSNTGIVSKDEILRFANSIGISPAIVAGRLRWETGDYKKYSAMLGSKTIKHLLNIN